MPQAPIPNSAGNPQPDNAALASMVGAKAPMRAGGSIMLSRAEAAALAVFETEEGDEAGSLKRAAAESGLTPEQVKLLKSRADTARKKGYSLKGANIQFQPHPEGDEVDAHGLVHAPKDEPTAKPAKKKAKEAAADDLDGVYTSLLESADALADEAAAVEPTDLSEAELREFWSQAARAAAAIARKARRGMSRAVGYAKSATGGAQRSGRVGGVLGLGNAAAPAKTVRARTARVSKAYAGATARKQPGEMLGIDNAPRARKTVSRVSSTGVRTMARVSRASTTRVRKAKVVKPAITGNAYSRPRTAGVSAGYRSGR